VPILPVILRGIPLPLDETLKFILEVAGSHGSGKFVVG
jgi:hypothetical protein